MTPRIISEPFRAGVAPGLYVPVPAHQAAIAQLHQVLSRGPAITLLVGDDGVGKSMLALQWLLQGVNETKIFPVYIANAGVTSVAEFHRALLHDLDKPGTNWFAVADALTNGPPKWLVLDDYDAASDDVLAEIRRIDNLGAVSTVIVGSTSLVERVRTHSALASRVHSIVRVEPLSVAESVQFIRGQCESFTDEAATMVAERAGGVPRLLNRLAADSQALAEDEVDVEAVLAALERSSGSVEFAPRAGSKGKGRQSHGLPVPKDKARSRKAA